MDLGLTATPIRLAGQESSVHVRHLPLRIASRLVHA